MSLFEFCPHCSAPLIEATLQSELRSMCSKQRGFIHYDNPTPVVAAVVEHNGRADPTSLFLTGSLP